jgi:hypothetical protein
MISEKLWMSAQARKASPNVANSEAVAGKDWSRSSGIVLDGGGFWIELSFPSRALDINMEGHRKIHVGGLHEKFKTNLNAALVNLENLLALHPISFCSVLSWDHVPDSVRKLIISCPDLQKGGNSPEEESV